MRAALRHRLTTQVATLSRAGSQNTLPGFLKSFTPRSRFVIHYDRDLYSSTPFTLAALNVLIVPETVITWMAFRWPLNVFHAFAGYESAFWRSAHSVAMTSDCAAQVASVFD